MRTLTPARTPTPSSCAPSPSPRPGAAPASSSSLASTSSLRPEVHFDPAISLSRVLSRGSGSAVPCDTRHGRSETTLLLARSHEPPLARALPHRPPHLTHMHTRTPFPRVPQKTSPIALARFFGLARPRPRSLPAQMKVRAHALALVLRAHVPVNVGLAPPSWNGREVYCNLVIADVSSCGLEAHFLWMGYSFLLFIICFAWVCGRGGGERCRSRERGVFFAGVRCDAAPIVTSSPCAVLDAGGCCREMGKVGVGRG
ncbi:hypothetical protein B0H16DRAFT_345154 [Mycena metata]|uniref:Uncharacterized protein n=1 Tax=Mycena metata TaxID=1033252 RepID=A0AAD7HL46_9AGAR|nr:hypothetical protein B0H16DRAFT_345154 [Mycena metata]